MIVKLIAIKGGPNSDWEANWLTDNKQLLESHYPFAAIELHKDKTIAWYRGLFAGQGIIDHEGVEKPDCPMQGERVHPDVVDRLAKMQ